MRIGLFGGTYNPVHFGHLRAAQEVLDKFHLDKIYLIPSAIPPHKNIKGIVSASERVEMINLAVSNNPYFIVSDVELNRKGHSYTIDTISYFKSCFSEETELYFIIGIDAFFEIHTWKSYKKLFALIPFILISRPMSNFYDENSKLTVIDNYIKSVISNNYIFSDMECCYIHKKMCTIFICNITAIDISSTKIRDMLKEGKSIKFLLPQSVEKFIKGKRLYL